MLKSGSSKSAIEHSSIGIAAQHATLHLELAFVKPESLCIQISTHPYASLHSMLLVKILTAFSLQDLII